MVDGRGPGSIYHEALAAYEVVNAILTREEEYRAINSSREFGPETYVSNIPKFTEEYTSAFNVFNDRNDEFQAAIQRTGTANDWLIESTNLITKKNTTKNQYRVLTGDRSGIVARYEPRRFAGVYFSDGHDPVEIRKTEQTKRAAEMYCGVVAVSGVVPLLCCDADIDAGNFTRGDELFLALRTKTGGRYTESTDYCQTVRPDKEADVYPMDEVAFATTGEFSHQQLAVAPVCLKPPEPPSDASNPNGVVWGCPRFAPVVLEADQGDMYPSVTGAVHAGARGSLDVGNVFTQSGARVFRIVNRATLLASADSFTGGPGAVALDDTDKAKLLEDHFIGNFVSKIGDGGGCMVRLGGLLLRTA